MQKEPELATTSLDIQEALLDNFDPTAKPVDVDSTVEDAPQYVPEGSEAAKEKLYKNDDPEVMNRYTGAYYEVYQFELWNKEDMAKYQEVMTSVGTDRYSAIIFQDRVFIKEKNSWKVLLELAHYVQVVK